MRVPKHLTGEAKTFWQDNAPHCERMGTLTEADRYTFTLLCQTWAKLVAAELNDLDAIKWVALNKQYQNLSKPFGLDPLSRKRLGIEVEAEAVDEFGL
jgi:phage terminase small subunit